MGATGAYDEMMSFQVYGLPAPQGSKTPWGAETSKRLPSWRQDVAVAARNAMGGRLPTTEAVLLDATFYFPRPKSHYGTGANAERLKATAPQWVAKKPDLDKLMRAIGDAITGVVVRDDSLIVKASIQKAYSEHPGVQVRVTELKGDGR